MYIILFIVTDIIVRERSMGRGMIAFTDFTNIGAIPVCMFMYSVFRQAGRIRGMVQNRDKVMVRENEVIK